MRFVISSLVALAIVSGAIAEPVRSINPPLSVVRDIDFANLPAAPEPVTNAERFAQGLPPKKPRSRKHHAGYLRDVAHLEQGTRVASAPRSETSPSIPVQKKCKIMVKANGNSAVYGYIRPTFNAFGQYGLQDTADGALVVSFAYSAGSSSALDFRAENGPTKAYPYVGAAVSFVSTSNDIGPRNSDSGSNYLYIVGTKKAPAGPAVMDDTSVGVATGIPVAYESAIWTFNPNSKNIDVKWVNSDGSTPATQVFYADDGNDTFLITGAGNSLPNTGGMNYPKVSFACTPVD